MVRFQSGEQLNKDGGPMKQVGMIMASCSFEIVSGVRAWHRSRMITHGTNGNYQSQEHHRDISMDFSGEHLSLFFSSFILCISLP